MDHRTSDGPASLSVAKGNGEKVEEKKSKIIDEIIATETTYVQDLTEVIDGYETPVVDNIDILGIPDEDVLSLFNNIEEIRDFSGYMLKTLQKCRYDVSSIGDCFVRIWETDIGLKIYSDYCSLYPKTVEVLTKCMRNPVLSQFFKDCQTKLGHMLPLGAYLIKPVQRVLKYSLLLEKLDKCLTAEEKGKEEIKAAFDTMTQVAEHINEVKKDYETSLLVQEIQSQLIGWEGNDLTTYGNLVEQDTFKYLGSKTTNTAIHLATDRHLLLFEELLLFTKKKYDHFVYQHHINVEDLQVDGRIPRFPLCFELYEVSTDKVFAFIATQSLAFVSGPPFYQKLTRLPGFSFLNQTFHSAKAETLDHKLDWVKQVDKVIERKLHMGLSDRTKLLLFAGIDAKPGHGVLQKTTSLFGVDSPDSRSPKKATRKESEELLKRQRKKVFKKKSSSLMFHLASNDPFLPSVIGKADGDQENNSEKTKSAHLLTRSQSAHSSLDSHHCVEVVSKGKLVKDFAHDEDDNTAMAVPIQRKKLVRRRKISAPCQSTDNPAINKASPIAHPAINEERSSRSDLTSGSLSHNELSSTTSHDGIDKLSRVLAEQQITYDDLSEMRPREPSIILPPPSDFTEQHHNKHTNEDGRTIVAAASTSSSSTHHEQHWEAEQRKNT